MKSTYRAFVVAILVMILMANAPLLAWGNPVPGKWEKVAETKLGKKITVHKKDRIIQECRYLSINDEFLTCSNKNEDKLQFELATIDKVVLQKAGKYAKHGALWGSLAGVGINWGVLRTANVDGGDWSPTGQFVFLVAAPLALGALGGYVIGAAIGAPGETVYISINKAMEEAKK